MYRNTLNSMRKSSNKLTYILMLTALAVLAIAITIVPASAASSQPQGAQASASGNLTGNTASANGGSLSQPDAACPSGGQCFADMPSSSVFYTFTNRIYQQDLVTGYACGGPGEPCDSENRPYYRPGDSVTRQQMAKFIDNARHQPGINIESTGVTPIFAKNSGGTAIYVQNTSGSALYSTSISGTALYGASTAGMGVYGGSSSSTGVYGISSGGTGVTGYSTSNEGVYGNSSSGNGVKGVSTSAYGLQGTSAGPAGINGYNTGTGYGVEGYGLHGIGVFGQSPTSNGVEGHSNVAAGVYGLSGTSWGVMGETLAGSTLAGVLGSSTNARGVYGSSTHSAGVYGDTLDGYAGWFQGNVRVTGTCTGCLGPTRMDDPIDPANKYLYHSPVQSDDMMNIYNGNVILDANGEAFVQMPDWFEALNQDFRYQLTTIGGFAPVYIAQKIEGNKFKIAGGTSGIEVSWQVTGVRHDPYAKANRVPVEQAKPATEQGKYLYPELYGQPASSGIDYKYSPESNKK